MAPCLTQFPAWRRFRPIRPAPIVPSDPDRDGELLQRLGALRSELDRIDDALHDGLMRRAELVVQVGALGAKGRVPLRPGREASILRRLVGRNRGALAPATVVRVWRELLAGSSAQQHAMRVVIGEAGLRPAVCEHFGALMQADVVSPAEAIEQVSQGLATIAVLPMPGPDVTWWTLLLDERWRGVHVVGRLPFWARPGMIEALVLSAAAPDPSGQDRTLVAGTETALRGFAVRETVAVVGSVVLAAIDGLVAVEAPIVTIGAYAIQMGADR